MTHPPPDDTCPYRWDDLGWHQFESLATKVLAVEAGLEDLRFSDRAYRGRVAWAPDVHIPAAGLRSDEPTPVLVLWSRPGSMRVVDFGHTVKAITRDLRLHQSSPLLIVTNLPSASVGKGLSLTGAHTPADPMIFGAHEFAGSLDRHATLRLSMPSVLGLRDLDPLIPAGPLARSGFDVERAHALARLFVPTNAYAQALAVLRRHRFVVLTGPPEMGKTAIAHMVALTQLTDGWEVHDCTSPAQVWKAMDADRAQVFVADDAFGSTEYRPDSAEEWARELGRILRELDDRHWLIWTSRPAPLRTGLRRVRRERGAERFPAPGEVLVDAGHLDLAEKTLILYRHAKAHVADGVTADFVRAAGVSIVEHRHFTPERIRRFVDERLDRLVVRLRHRGPRKRERALRRAVWRQLAKPTAAMVASYNALGEEHRAMLIALLDTPAGLTDERELTATLRRHHPAGLTRPAHELIDRLTDHFLRHSALGIDWVHPSWRDVVIDELRADAEQRQRFLRACSLHGVSLVLSVAGGASGKRVLPLLTDDQDWDALSDRLAELLRDMEDPDTSRLLAALAETLRAGLPWPATTEARAVAEYLLGATRRAWNAKRAPIPVFLLEAWFELACELPDPLAPPDLAATWAELHPGPAASLRERSELARTLDWLTLAELLEDNAPRVLEGFGFPAAEARTLAAIKDATTDLPIIRDSERRRLLVDMSNRLRRLVPAYETAPALVEVEPARDETWWVPEDLPAPPSTERVTPTAFTREDVERVLRDL